MARYKHIDTSPRFIAIDLERQLLPGTFEYALNYLVDHELDLRRFDARYKNDLTGAAGTCFCPAGKQLYQNGANCKHNGYLAVKFQGAQRDCVPCAQRAKCLRSPKTSKTRQVSFFRGKVDPELQSLTERMKQAIDSERGRELYGGRFATVEPVFGNIRHNKRLDHFTLRGQKKVDTQWKLYCLVHNIEKLAHHGYAQ